MSVSSCATPPAPAARTWRATWPRHGADVVGPGHLVGKVACDETIDGQAFEEARQLFLHAVEEAPEILAVMPEMCRRVRVVRLVLRHVERDHHRSGARLESAASHLPLDEPKPSLEDQVEHRPRRKRAERA